MQTESTDKDVLNIEMYLIRTNAGKRFANYIIDLIFFTILFVGIGILLTIVTDLADELVDSDAFGFVTLIIYAIYMSLSEAIFNGKSFGKLITRTRAINSDGSRISKRTAFARGFIRIVPFCAFSALGNPCNPWQDKWTDTIVIDDKNYTNPVI